MQLVLALVGCSVSSVPTAATLQGGWDTWCATDDPSDSVCLGQDPVSIRKEFRPDGTVAMTVVGRAGDTPEIGTWTLAGDQLELRFGGGGFAIVEQYRARIEGDRLILWKEDQGFGSILHRVGAAAPVSSGPVSDGSPVERTLGGLRYTLPLPPGYRLVRDDNDRQAWAIPDGFRVDMMVAPRPTDGDGVPVPCDASWGGIGSAGQVIDGVERTTSIGRDRCVDPGGRSFVCDVSHARGWLEEAERDAAIALCAGLTLR